MNREHLIKTIHTAMRPSPSGNGKAARKSLENVVRDTRQQLASSRIDTPLPDHPLPSAECIAGFVEGNTSLGEAEQVVRASIHDVGILLQVVAAVQTDQEALPASDAHLVDRLLANVVSQSTFVAKSNRPSEPTSVEQDVATGTRDQTDVLPAYVEPSSLPSSSRRATMAVLATIAAVLLLVVGWQMLPWWKPASEMMVESEVEPVTPPSIDLAEDTPDVPTDEANSTYPDTQLAIELAIEKLEDQIASENEPDSNTGSPVNPNGNSPELPGGTVVAAENGTPDAGDTAMQDGVADLSESQMVAEREANWTLPEMEATFPVGERASLPIEWTRVTGFLVRQAETGYDKWEVASANARNTHATETAGGPASWLTLPGCYASGELSGGGRLVVREDTSLQTLQLQTGPMNLNLRFGTVAFVDLPAGRAVHLSGLPAQTTFRNRNDRSGSSFETLDRKLVIDQVATLQLQRFVGGVRIVIEDGTVRYGDRQLPVGKWITVSAKGAHIGQDAQIAEWVVDFPSDGGLARKLLANLDRNMELGAAIDRQLVSMARSLKPNNVTGLKNFRQLCRWRARLAVEDNSGATLHPLWFVRSTGLDMMLTDQNHIPSLVGRRLMLLKVQAELANLTQAKPANGTVGNTRNQAIGTATGQSASTSRTTGAAASMRVWIEVAKGNRRATRQDAAKWLGFLVSEDPHVAALGDYLLRKSFTGGPNFDPNGPVALRTRVQQAWRRVVAAASDRG